MSNRLSLISLSRILRVEATSVRIDKRNLLEARMIVTTYNDHVRLLSPEPWLVSATKVYSGVGADIVMESFHSSTVSETSFPLAHLCKGLVSTVSSGLPVRTKPLARRTLARVRCRRLKRWSELWS